MRDALIEGTDAMNRFENEDEASLRARYKFDLEHEIVEISADDDLFVYDADLYKAIDAEKPWKSDPKYFTRCVLRSVSFGFPKNNSPSTNSLSL